MLKNRYTALLGAICVGVTVGNPSMAGLAQSVLPEEVEIKLVSDLSDKLAVRLNSSSCVEFNELLDGAQSDAADETNGSSIVKQVLEDVKTNPKLRTIVISKLGEPLLKKTLDCNLVPIGALGDEKSEIQDIMQLNNALISILNTSDCPAFNQILDNAQANAESSHRDETLTVVNQLLADAKTNPETQTKMIDALGDPLLSKVLDCNLIPFSALQSN